MYESTKWLDRVVDAETGDVLQEGTDQSAANFNNMEKGITDAHIAMAIFQAAANKIGLDNMIITSDGLVYPGITQRVYYPAGYNKNNTSIISKMVSIDGETYGDYLTTDSDEVVDARKIGVCLEDQYIAFKNHGTNESYYVKLHICRIK